MATFNYSDNNLVEQYTNRTQAVLAINSAVNAELSVEFPAFLTDFSQTFDATWNSENVYGRMDPIATYQSTKRTVSLGFDVPAASLAVAKKNLEKTQNLIKMVYPVYKNIGGAKIISKPPLVRVSFANLLRKNTVLKEGASDNTGPLGWISGLSWNPEIQMGMFASNKEFFPKVIKISFQFNILHETTLGQTESDLASWPFGEGS